MSVDYGDGNFFPVLHKVIWLGVGQVESRLIQSLSKKVKIDDGKFRTHADRAAEGLSRLRYLGVTGSVDWLL